MAWIGSTQLKWWQQWWRWGVPIAGISTAGSNGPTSGLHPHVVQALQKLELLPHSRWQGQQWAHQQGVHQTGPCIQSTCIKDQHDERVSHGPPQNNSTFGLRPFTPRPVPATSLHPSKLAVASAPCHLHHLYAADDASCTLPPDALHGAAIWTYPLSCHSACTSCTRTSGGYNDDALLCTVPSASSLLTVRGKQR